MFKECRLCHRVGERGYVPSGSENHIWECSNDRACRKREIERRAHGDGATLTAPE